MSESTATHDSIEPKSRSANVKCTDGSNNHMMYKRGRKTITATGDDDERKIKEWSCVNCGLTQYEPPSND